MKRTGKDDLVTRAAKLFSVLDDMEESEKIEAINALRLELHKKSPFASEPVDCVQWVRGDALIANDYNPNAVAPPEMKLLEHSILEDGYTQPIVAWMNESCYEVVDGFHRNRVGKECSSVKERTLGYLPITVINSTRTDRGDRIAATIRHNRARGKHQVDAMSDIVVELKRRNWSDERIGNELGMDPDEVLRLTQIAGLTEVFADQQFSEAWEHDGPADEVQESEDDEEINLEWMNNVVLSQHEPGWSDRTETSSVLYGENGKHLGLIQKSRFTENEWFCYVYTGPIVEGRQPSKKKAMEFVEDVLKADVQQ